MTQAPIEVDPSQDKTSSASPAAAAAYAVLAIINLAVAIAVGWWIAIQADLLGVRFDRAYLVLLIILGLAAALMLFGAMRSAAKVSGQHLGLAVDVGGPAALFILVVAGGHWLTQPPPSFNEKVVLRYAGPTVDRPAYDVALRSAKLRVAVGLRTDDYPVSDQGEIAIWDIPGRFRDGTFTVELLSERILLLDHDTARQIRFPGPDQVVVLRAALSEPPERRTERERASEALKGVIVAVQKTLMRQDNLLFPAIDDFLSSPSDQRWQRVLVAATQTEEEIQRGIDIALEYDARWGGLLGTPRQVSTSLTTATRDPLDGRLPSQLGSLVTDWQNRRFEITRGPSSRVTNDVVRWRDQLKEAYKKVLNDLTPLVERLNTPT